MSSVILRKNGGFYAVYDDDTYILNYLFNYKIKDNKVGFPVSALNKVINVLENNLINYRVIDGNEVDYKKRNNYEKFVKLGKKKYSLTFRINEIIVKLDTLNEKDIDKILEYIENFYEWKVFNCKIC